MPLNMLKTRRLPKRREIPIQIPHPLVDIWKLAAADGMQVCFEECGIYDVEADDGHVEADVGFGQ